MAINLQFSSGCTNLFKHNHTNDSLNNVNARFYTDKMMCQILNLEVVVHYNADYHVHTYNNNNSIDNSLPNEFS